MGPGSMVKASQPVRLSPMRQTAPARTTRLSPPRAGSEQPHMAERRSSLEATALENHRPTSSARVSVPLDEAEELGFGDKLKKVWDIFFPESNRNKPKDEAKRRLRMILVADRCGLSDESFTAIQASVVKAVQQYVEVSPEQNVGFTINTHPELGTICSVDVPVRRVRTQAMSEVERVAALERGEDLDDEWKEDDINSDPSSRFPMGC